MKSPLKQLVYFIEAEGCDLIKIGIAVRVKRRLGVMQIGCPYPLKLMATCEGGRIREGEIHRQFAKDRYRAEWFHATPSLRSFISRLSIIEPKEREFSMDELHALIKRIPFPPAPCVTQN